MAMVISTALKADSIAEAVLAECSGFLCGACSCQVKEINPGFDLLLAVNWDERLSGELDIALRTTPTQPLANAGEEPSEPTYVAIAPGRKETPASGPRRPSGRSTAGQPDHGIYWAALSVAALVVSIVLGARWISSANRE
ncbi:MAG TPA: hypothetical protein VFI31_25590 [Pirellulales bacterium]|nr:hypothetical protein [Pirellulales bacterium]